MATQTEQLTWHLDPDDLPDDDIEVLVQTAEDRWWLAYHDDEVWRETRSDLVIDSVVAWADFKGADVPEPPEQLDIEDAAA